MSTMAETATAGEILAEAARQITGGTTKQTAEALREREHFIRVTGQVANARRSLASTVGAPDYGTLSRAEQMKQGVENLLRDIGPEGRSTLQRMTREIARNG